MDLEIQLPLELTPGPSEGHFAKRQDVRAFAKGAPMNMIRKFIVAAVATAIATSFLPPSSFAKKSAKAKEKPCTVGQVCMKKPDKNGWGTVMRCTYDRKMIGDFSPCNVRSGMCPTTICKEKKKK